MKINASARITAIVALGEHERFIATDQMSSWQVTHLSFVLRKGEAKCTGGHGFMIKQDGTVGKRQLVIYSGAPLAPHITQPMIDAVLDGMNRAIEKS